MKKLRTQMLSRPTAPECESGKGFEIDREVLKIVGISLARVSTWRLPRNWSRTEWAEQMEGVAFAAGRKAAEEHAAHASVAFGAFVYEQVMAQLLDACRKEWRFAKNCAQAA